MPWVRCEALALTIRDGYKVPADSVVQIVAMRRH